MVVLPKSRCEERRLSPPARPVSSDKDACCVAADTRDRPVLRPATGRAGYPCSFLPEGRAERLGEKPRPRRPQLLMRASRMPEAHGWWSSPAPTSVRTEPGLGRRSSPAFRTRMDFAACCITDRELSLAPTPPGPRELSRGHALGPSARRVGVNLLSDNGSRL